MKKLLKINILSLIILLLTACNGSNKDKWKLPTQVGLMMDINRNPNTEGTLVFTEGTIILAAFDFEGKREQGEDVFFSREFDQGYAIPFDPNTAITELDFDIPQGTYTRIRMSFETYDDGENSSIVVNGIYINSVSEEIPIKFEFNSSEHFSIEGEDDNGDKTLVLDKDIPASGLIKLDPIHWFDIISMSALDDAETTIIDGEETILVNKEINDHIFDLIVDRLDESTEAVFTVD